MQLLTAFLGEQATHHPLHGHVYILQSRQPVGGGIRLWVNGRVGVAAGSEELAPPRQSENLSFLLLGLGNSVDTIQAVSQTQQGEAAGQSRQEAERECQRQQGWQRLQQGSPHPLFQAVYVGRDYRMTRTGLRASAATTPRFTIPGKVDQCISH